MNSAKSALRGHDFANMSSYKSRLIVELCTVDNMQERQLPVDNLSTDIGFCKIGPFGLQFCERCQAENLDFPSSFFTIDNMK